MTPLQLFLGFGTGGGKNDERSFIARVLQGIDLNRDQVRKLG
jgi:hypothetical protein